MSAGWRKRAACAGQAGLFFPPAKGETLPARAARVAAATELCGACPVRADCLGFAVGMQANYGIFGGTDFGVARARQKAAREAGAGSEVAA